IPSWRSISPTDRSEETRRLKIARRFGSAMISKTDSTAVDILRRAYTCQVIYYCPLAAVRRVAASSFSDDANRISDTTEGDLCSSADRSGLQLRSRMRSFSRW